MEEKHTTPLKAIRLKCLDCCCGSAHEVKLCPASSCPLYTFRLGKNPNRAGIGGNISQGAKQRNSTSDPATNKPVEGVYTPKNDSDQNPDRMEESICPM